MEFNNRAKGDSKYPPKMMPSVVTTLSSVSLDPNDPKSYGYDSDFDVTSIATTFVGHDQSDSDTLPDDWPQKIQGCKPGLLGLIRHLVLNHELTDCTVTVGGKKFHCHKIVLQCYSQYFRDERAASEYTLPADQVTVKGFVMLYDWMLADRPIIHRACLIELFRAATHLGVDELERQCWRCIDNDENMREEEALKLYDEAQAFNFTYMNSVLMTRITKYFLAFVGTDRFLALPLEDLCYLFGSDAIGVNSEMEVMVSAIRWISHDFENRKCHSAAVLEHVRFPLMPCWYLASLGESLSGAVVNPMAIIVQQAAEHIHAGLSFATAVENRVMGDDDFEEFIKTHYNIVPRQRRWILDPECPYHHHYQCKRGTPLTLEMFTYYTTRFRTPQYYNSWRNFMVMAYDQQQPELETGNVYCPNCYCQGPVLPCRLPWRPKRHLKPASSLTAELQQHVVNVSELQIAERSSAESSFRPRKPVAHDKEPDSKSESSKRRVKKKSKGPIPKGPQY